MTCRANKTRMTESGGQTPFSRSIAASPSWQTSVASAESLNLITQRREQRLAAWGMLIFSHNGWLIGKDRAESYHTWSSFLTHVFNALLLPQASDLILDLIPIWASSWMQAAMLSNLKTLEGPASIWQNRSRNKCAISSFCFRLCANDFGKNKNLEVGSL